MRKVRAKKLRKAAQVAEKHQLIAVGQEKNFYQYLKKKWKQNSELAQKP